MENKIDPKILESGRLDRMEHHLKLMKESSELMTSEIHKISSALVGNEYTGGVGIVHQMKNMKDSIDKSKDDIDILKENMNLVKWIGSALVGFVITIIAYILQKQL